MSAVDEFAALVDAASPIPSALVAIGAVWLGHRLGSSRRQEDLLFERKVDAITDFPGACAG